MAYQKPAEYHILKDLPNLISDIYFHYCATNKKVANTYLWHAMESQTMYHLIAKEKVTEQNI